MIKNERQYRITKSEADKFDHAITDLTRDASVESDPVRKLELDALRSQMSDLRAELAEYEALQSGKETLVESTVLEDLPKMLVKARIAGGLSHKDLAQRLNLKEQQIQRYETTDYSGASVARLMEVARALGLKARKDFFLPTLVKKTVDFFNRLQDFGLEKDFVLRRLVPNPDSTHDNQQSRDLDVIFHATSAISHIFGWTPEAIIGTEQLYFDEAVLGTARFKVNARAEEKRLGAYTFYAHYLAAHLLVAAKDIPIRQQLPDSPQVVRAEILHKFHELTFRSALSYVWDLGIPVLPLNDPGAFHGATWRLDGRNVIVLKQQTNSVARWLHDLLHEFKHTSEEPENKERTVIESSELSPERRNSKEEWEATQFSADVVLAGRAEELAKICVDATKKGRRGSGNVELLKSVVPQVAEREGVPVDSLANYLAFRLSMQNIDWWGTAQILQKTDENPWQIARDILLQRVKLANVPSIDRPLLIRALTDVEG